MTRFDSKGSSRVCHGDRMIVADDLSHALRESKLVVIIGVCSRRSQQLDCPRLPAIPPKSGASQNSQAFASTGRKRGQVAQVVERSPEKAGVGGSTPSLATINSKTYGRPAPRFGHNWSQINSPSQPRRERLQPWQHGRSLFAPLPSSRFARSPSAVNRRRAERIRREL